MAKKYIVKEGILSKFVNSVMDNIVDNQRQKNKKILKKAHDAELERLEKKAAEAIGNFKDYLSNQMTDDEKDYISNLRSKR